MKKIYLLLFTALATFNYTPVFAQAETFSMRQLACGLSQPWEIKWGPDGYLWVTEAYSYQLSRIDVSNGNVELLLDLASRKNFPNFHEADHWPQGGLQGFAFHPNFSTNPYVYIAYVYHLYGCLPDTMGCMFRTKIVRYNYNATTKVFSNEMVVTDSIPGSTDHNGGRLVTGPADSSGQHYLFYSVGDMGAGQLDNSKRPNHAQMPEIYEGKVLRFNLVPDNDSLPYSWIPNDNPFNKNGQQLATWSLGHRNPQGLVFSTDGAILYEAEHGPYSDDEINLIKKGFNYGHPLIEGYVDGNYDSCKAGGGSTMPVIWSETANRDSIMTMYPYSDPLKSFFPAPRSAVKVFNTNDINHTPPFANYYLQYPTIAPSGIDYYGSNAIPTWRPSLLVANLKMGNVYRLQLSTDRTSIVSDSIAYFKGLGRFRDLAISSDGTKIYVAADSIGVLKGAPGEAVQPPNKGCVLEFTYVPTGVAEHDLGNYIQVYPNPAHDFATLLMPPNMDKADVTVYNIAGVAVAAYRDLANNATINTGGYRPGIYVVEIAAGTSVYRKKLVVQ